MGGHQVRLLLLTCLLISFYREYWSFGGGANNLIEREGHEEEGWVSHQNYIQL